MINVKTTRFESNPTVEGVARFSIGPFDTERVTFDDALDDFADFYALNLKRLATEHKGNDERGDYMEIRYDGALIATVQLD